jgi:hypothetical protein
MKMSQENLLKARQLQPHSPARDAAQRLLHAAARNIADAHVEKISGENRFDAACKAIMQCAMVALWVNRYRTSTSQPGHHQIAIQTLTKTIGLEQSTVIVWTHCANSGMSAITKAIQLATKLLSSASSKRNNFTRL